MGIFNQNSAFLSCRKKTQPVYKVPARVQEILQISQVHKNGIFETEPGNQVKAYDKCYLFQDVNYIDKDEEEKGKICLNYCKILNMLNLNFKITLLNSRRNIDKFYAEIMKDPEKSDYPDLAEKNNQLIAEALEKGTPQIEQKRLLTITTQAKNIEEAEHFFSTLEITLKPAFRECESALQSLTTMERLELLHDLHRPDEIGEFSYTWEELQQKRDWRNEICPYSVGQDKEPDYMQLGKEFVSTLVAVQLPNSLNESKVISSFFNVGFPSIVTLDVAHIPRDILTGKLTASYTNNEMAINREAEVNAKNKNIGAPPSYLKQKKRDNLEEAMEEVDENDENGFYMGFLISVIGSSLKELDSRIDTILLQAKRLGIRMIPYEYEQLEAWNTALPIGTRQVNYMRPMLTNSMVAFQPFHAVDVIEPGGYFFGVNKRTGNIIMLNRKKLKNSNGVIFGHTGSGKSMLLKMTEIGQALIDPDMDDIFVIDPQNELEGITKHLGGHFYDLTPKSAIHINPFEVPEEIFYADQKRKDHYVAVQSSYAEAFCYSTMMGITPNGIHKTIINRCVIEMYRAVFSKKQLKQPTLNQLYELIAKSEEPEARDIYGSLGAHVQGGSFDIFSYPSNLKITGRFNVFGLKNVPNDLWESSMDTIMHFLAQRMENNMLLHKATHFIIDEAQYVARNEYSALQMEKAFLTFRKYGGINTILMQNIGAALSNGIIKEIVDNADFKLFLDQAGSDRNLLAEIMPLSHSEFAALANKEVGQCVIAWGDKILLCDSKISKSNPLYTLYSTNFHEAAKEGRSAIYRYKTPEDEKSEANQKEEISFTEEKVADTEEIQEAWMMLEDFLPLSEEEIRLLLAGKEELLEELVSIGKIENRQGHYYALTR